MIDFQYEKWDNTLQSIPWDSCCYDPPSRSEVVDSLVASRSCCASEHDITGIMGRKKSPAAWCFSHFFYLVNDDNSARMMFYVPSEKRGFMFRTDWLAYFVEVETTSDFSAWQCQNLKSGSCADDFSLQLAKDARWIFFLGSHAMKTAGILLIYDYNPWLFDLLVGIHRLQGYDHGTNLTRIYLRYMIKPIYIYPLVI